jgi:acyl-CoA dehydrogenase
MKTFDASRPAVAASAMGIARAALEFTQRAAGGRRYQGRLHQAAAHVNGRGARPDGDGSAHKGAWLLTLRATALMAHGESNRLEASMCKYRAGEAVTWITQKAVELLGPDGLLARAGWPKSGCATPKSTTSTKALSKSTSSSSPAASWATAGVS